MKNFNDLKQYASLTWAVYADATDKVIPKEYNKTEYKSQNSRYTSGFQALLIKDEIIENNVKIFKVGGLWSYEF